MADYELIAKSLRICAEREGCDGCMDREVGPGCEAYLSWSAAGAIEDLLAEVKELNSEISQLKKKADLANVDQLQTLIHQTENALLFPAPPAPQRRGPMYIMTNDGKRVFLSSKFGRYSVTSDHCVTATPHRELFFETLGVYPDNGAATAALEGLLYALGSGAPIYRMPPASWQDEIPAWSETVKPC